MVDVHLQARVDSGSGFGALQDTAIVIDPDNVVRFSAPSYVGWTSPAAFFQFGKGEYPPGWPCPAGWTDVSGSYRFTCSNIDGFTPPDVAFPSPGGIWGKWRCALVVNGGGQGLEDELFVEIVGPNGTHDIVPGESEQFGTAGQTYLGPQRENLRLVDEGVAAASDKVDALAWKAPVRGVAAADVTNLASFTVAQGDITYIAGDRVFLGPNQVSNVGTSIGIFVVGTVGAGAAPLTRAPDADTAAKLLCAVFVALAGTKAGKIYKVTNTSLTLGLTTITFEEGGLLTAADKAKLDAATASATPTTLVLRGSDREAAFDYLYSGGSLPTVGFLRHRSGFTYIASTTASGGFDNEGFVDDGFDGWRVGNSTRAAAVRLSVKTGGSATWEVNNVVEGTMDADGINLSSGNSYRINSLDVVSVSGDVTSIGRDVSGSVAIRAANGKSVTLWVDAGEVAVADGDGITFPLGAGFMGAPASPRISVTGSRGGNAALASFLTAMATFGLITDNTTP